MTLLNRKKKDDLVRPEIIGLACLKSNILKTRKNLFNGQKLLLLLWRKTVLSPLLTFPIYDWHPFALSQTKTETNCFGVNGKLLYS